MSGGFVLEIEELLVEGVVSSERSLVALALERELRRLVAERGVPAGLAGAGDLPLLEVESAITPSDRATTIGTKAGRALYGALPR